MNKKNNKRMLTIKNKNILKINDNEINNYLDARNYKFNKIKMINKNLLIDWNTTTGGLVIKEICLFRLMKIKKFLGQDRKYKKKEFLVGGWHSNISKINLYIILL